MKRVALLTLSALALASLSSPALARDDRGNIGNAAVFTSEPTVTFAEELRLAKQDYLRSLQAPAFVAAAILRNDAPSFEEEVRLAKRAALRERAARR